MYVSIYVYRDTNISLDIDTFFREIYRLDKIYLVILS